MKPMPQRGATLQLLQFVHLVLRDVAIHCTLKRLFTVSGNVLTNRVSLCTRYPREPGGHDLFPVRSGLPRNAG